MLARSAERHSSKLKATNDVAVFVELMLLNWKNIIILSHFWSPEDEPCWLQHPCYHPSRLQASKKNSEKSLCCYFWAASYCDVRRTPQTPQGHVYASYCKFYMTSVVKAFINMYFLHAFWDTCFSVQCLAATIKKTQLNCVGGPLYGLTANLRHEFLKRSTEELLRYILIQYIRFQKSSFHFIKGCWNRGFQVEEWLKASRTEGKKERAR